MSVKKILILLLVALPIAILAVFGILSYQQLPLKTALYYRDAGDLPTALASVDQYLSVYPGDEYALSLKAQILCAENRFLETIGIYQEIGPASREDLLCFTKALVGTQRWQMAAKTSETFEKQYGDEADNYLWSVISHSNLGEIDLAVDQSKKLAGIAGKESQGLLLYGDLKAKQNAMDEAIKAWAKVIDLNPEASGFHIEPEVFFENYASLLLSLGKSTEAISLIDKGLAVRETPSLRYYRGNAFLNLGETEKAKTEWLLANRDGIHIDSHLALAKQLLKENEPKKAAKVLELLKNLEEIDSRFAFLMKGICDALQDPEKSAQWNAIYEQMKQSETIESVMRTVITEQPRNEWSLVFRAYFSAKSNQWEMAEELMQGIEENFKDEVAYGVLKSAILNQKLGPEVLKSMGEKGIGLNQ